MCIRDRVVAAQGARAVATASWAMSAAAGRPDGEGLDLGENLTVVARIAAAVDLPVTGDLERGYGRTPEHVASSVLRLLTAGAVGCHIEDSLVQLGRPDAGSGLRPVAEQVQRLAAAREAGRRAGVHLVLNARTDAVARGGEVDDAVRRLADAFDGRLNVLGRPGMPSIAELADAGVCRISIGSTGPGIAYAAFGRAAAQLLAGGDYLPEHIPDVHQDQRLAGP